MRWATPIGPWSPEVTESQSEWVRSQGPPPPPALAPPRVPVSQYPSGCWPLASPRQTWNLEIAHPQGARCRLSGSETAQLPSWPPRAPAAPSILGKARAPQPGRQAHMPASPTLYLSHTMPLFLLQHDLYDNWPAGRLGRSRPADMFCLAKRSASKEFELVANFEKSDFT